MAQCVTAGGALWGCTTGSLACTQGWGGCSFLQPCCAPPSARAPQTPPPRAITAMASGGPRRQSAPLATFALVARTRPHFAPLELMGIPRASPQGAARANAARAGTAWAPACAPPPLAMANAPRATFALRAPQTPRKTYVRAATGGSWVPETAHAVARATRARSGVPLRCVLPPLAPACARGATFVPRFLAPPMPSSALLAPFACRGRPLPRPAL